jgi:hypothetical protein
VKIRIIGTEEECQVASDLIARFLDVRSMPSPTYTEQESGKFDYRVQFDARLRKGREED